MECLLKSKCYTKKEYLCQIVSNWENQRSSDDIILSSRLSNIKSQTQFHFPVRNTLLLFVTLFQFLQLEHCSNFQCKDVLDKRNFIFDFRNVSTRERNEAGRTNAGRV